MDRWMPSGHCRHFDETNIPSTFEDGDEETEKGEQNPREQKLHITSSWTDIMCSVKQAKTRGSQKTVRVSVNASVCSGLKATSFYFRVFVFRFSTHFCESFLKKLNNERVHFLTRATINLNGHGAE